MRVEEKISNEGGEITSFIKVVHKYDEAYAQALANGYVQDAAVAKELMWEVLKEWSGQALSEAVYCYSSWGASAKTKALASQASVNTVPQHYRSTSSATIGRAAIEGPASQPTSAHRIYSTTEIISR